MKFKYYLSGIGWATCNVEINTQKLEFTVSYLTNCLDNFLKSLMYLNSFCVPKCEVRKKTECEWEGEPEGIVWSFELKEKNSLFIEVMYYEDLYNKDSSQTLIKTEYQYDEFLRIVLIELDALIRKHGIIGYREQWSDSEFPLSTFLKLKHYIINNKKYPVKEVIGEFDKETRSDLKYDLELLLEEITKFD
ncbi:hypothetical protein [Metabacillus fastidiosus]|uniref:hypothetical protein n=1 Tax=Metabacillus fastidiosus TaxID=1458 RepID=UPI002E2062C9|nr:hypothetical protein [Metabacillus fastidiosus]